MKEIRSAAGPLRSEDVSLKETGRTGRTRARLTGAGRLQLNDIYECVL